MHLFYTFEVFISFDLYWRYRNNGDEVNSKGCEEKGGGGI